MDFLKFSFQSEEEQKLINYINQYVFPSDDYQIVKNVRQGDFGEILASLIVSFFEGLAVPINKMRWKFNKDRSVFCTDMIAHNSTGDIKDLYYYEIKTKLNLKKIYPEKGQPGIHITVLAHDSLLSDNISPNEGIADFLSRYYFEEEEYDKATKYKDIVINPSSYNKHYELFFVIEKKEYIVDILDDLHNLPPTLNPLKVTVVLLENLDNLISTVKNRAIQASVNFVYNK